MLSLVASVSERMCDAVGGCECIRTHVCCCLHMSCEAASVVQGCVVSHLHAARDDWCVRMHIFPAARVDAYERLACLNEQKYNPKCGAISHHGDKYPEDQPYLDLGQSFVPDDL